MPYSPELEGTAAGPEITVSPFTGRTVSTSAGIIKALTAIGARRRAETLAASARQAQAQQAQRDALSMLQLEQATEREDYKGRDGVVRRLTPAQANAAATSDNPLAKEATPRKRQPFNAKAYEWGKDVISYDPVTNTADEVEVRQAAAAWAAAQRIAAARARAGGSSRSEIPQIRAAIEGLDAEAEVGVNRGLTWTNKAINQALAAFRGPDPAARARAAATLGIPIAKGDDGEVLKDAQGNPVYDARAIEPAVAALRAQAKVRFGDRMAGKQKPKRAALQSRLEKGLLDAAEGVAGADWQSDLDAIFAGLDRATEED